MVALFITTADFIEGYGIALAAVLIASYAIIHLERRRDQEPLELD